MSPRPLDLAVLREALAGSVAGEIVYEPLALSTHDRARREAAERPGGTLYLADGQSAGRGRGGRPWFSPEGLGVCMTLVLKPQGRPVPASSLGILGLMTALETARAVESLAGVRPALRWPNDLLAGGRKLAGVLAESATRGDEVRHAVLSVGLNVNVPRDLFPDVLRHAATSLLEVTGREHPREPLVAAIAMRLLDLWAWLPDTELAPGLAAWEEACPAVRGARVRLRHAGIVREADTLGLDEAGRLRVRFTGGAEAALADAEILEVFSPAEAPPPPGAPAPLPSP